MSEQLSWALRKLGRRPFLKLAAAFGIVASVPVVAEIHNIASPASAPPLPTLPSLPPLDPDDLLVSFFTKLRTADYAGGIRSTEFTLERTPTIVQLNSSDATQILLEMTEAIKGQIIARGKIHTLGLTGDGNTDSIAVSEPLPPNSPYGGAVGSIPGTPANTLFELVDFMNIFNSLVNLQQQGFPNHTAGMPLARNFLCDACDVAAGLTPDQADSFSQFAVTLGFPIILAVTEVFFTGQSRDEGVFVQFNTDGTLTTNLSVSDQQAYNQDCNATCENIAVNTQWIADFRQRHHQQTTPSPLTTIGPSALSPAESENHNFSPAAAPEQTGRRALPASLAKRVAAALVQS